MYTLVLALLGAMLTVTAIATTTPQQYAMQEKVKSSAMAANFWAFRSAAVAWQNNNPGVEGVVPIASLVFPRGYVHQAGQYQALINNQILYTYSTGDADDSLAYEIYRYGGSSFMVGTMRYANNFSPIVNGTYVNLPFNAPVGAVMVIGN